MNIRLTIYTTVVVALLGLNLALNIYAANVPMVTSPASAEELANLAKTVHSL